MTQPDMSDEELVLRVRQVLKDQFTLGMRAGMNRAAIQGVVRAPVIVPVVAASEEIMCLIKSREQQVAVEARSKKISDAIHDGQELMKFVAARIIDHELRGWGYNTNAARALKTVKQKIVEHDGGIICVK